MTTTVTAADEHPDWSLPARLVAQPSMPRRSADGTWSRVDYLLIVTDPDLGEVPVRWRILDSPHAWLWRCPACSLRTRHAACRHTFAAGIALARQLLGLNPVGIAPDTTEGTQTA